MNIINAYLNVPLTDSAGTGSQVITASLSSKFKRVKLVGASNGISSPKTHFIFSSKNEL